MQHTKAVENSIETFSQKENVYDNYYFFFLEA